MTATAARRRSAGFVGLVLALGCATTAAADTASGATAGTTAKRPAAPATTTKPAAPATTTTTTIVFCAPGSPGTTEEAQGAMNAFAAAIADRAGMPGSALAATYAATEDVGVARIRQDAGAVMVSLPFFLKHEKELGLEPTGAQAVMADAARAGARGAADQTAAGGTADKSAGEKGASEKGAAAGKGGVAAGKGADAAGAGASDPGLERWTLVAARGRVKTPAALEGFTLMSTAGYAPAFVRGMLGSFGTLPASVKVAPATAVLSALRRASAGEPVAVLLDGTQAAALPGLAFAKDLETVARSEPVPVGIVATVGARVPPATWRRVETALLSLHESPGGANALAGIRVARFEPLDTAALARARKSFSEAAR